MSKRYVFTTIAIGAVILLVAYLAVKKGTSEPQTLNLAEYGVALTVPSSLDGLSYEVREQESVGPILYMHTKKNCEIGAFFQIRKDEVEASGTPWTEETLEQFQLMQGDKPAQVKEFTDFYLVFEPSVAPCAADEDEAEHEVKQRTDLWNALSTARYMSY